MLFPASPPPFMPTMEGSSKLSGNFRIQEGSIKVRIVRRVGTDVLELLDDVLRCWGFHGQMSSLRLETVVIGHVDKRNVGTVRSGLYEPSSLMIWSCWITMASLSGPPPGDARTAFLGGAAATRQRTNPARTIWRKGAVEPGNGEIVE
uniref:Uncharacterized protein n=1 Tax=Anopheles merus TaxID=30066 RepID=A0A182VJK2_ANOME